MSSVGRLVTHASVVSNLPWEGFLHSRALYLEKVLRAYQLWLKGAMSLLWA